MIIITCDYCKKPIEISHDNSTSCHVSMLVSIGYISGYPKAVASYDFHPECEKPAIELINRAIKTALTNG